MAQLLSTGLSTRTVMTTKAELEAALKSALGENIDLSTTSPLGQFVAIIAQDTTLLEEALAAVYNAMDPTAATGDALDRIAAFNGVYRREATRTTLSASLFFSQTGTYTSGTLLANPVGNESSLFENVDNIVVTTTPFTASNVLMRALDTGPINVILGATGNGSLTEIASPVAGWDSIQGTSNLSQGTNIESDSELRFRRVQELFQAGSTSVNGIRADISSRVSGVRSVTVFENTSSSTVNLQPAYSIEVVVDGPSATDEDIATSIFRSKSAGAPTYGNTQFDVADSSGNLHTISFSRPVEIPVAISMDVIYRPGSVYPGDDFVKQTIISNATASWVPGLDASPSQIAHWVFDDVPGILAVENSQVDGSPTRRAISIRQIAVITASTDITINSSVGTP